MKKTSRILSILVILLALIVVSVSADGAYVGKKSQIDAATDAEGYISAVYQAGANKKIKVTIETGSAKYTYDLSNDGTWETYPLQLGDGEYRVKVLENTTGNKYAVIQNVTFSVKLKSPFAPFLAPSQYVDFNSQSKAVLKAAELTKGCKTDLEKVDKIYKYVIDLLQYDSARAATVQSGYLPDIDAVMEAKKGICFDYSALMAAMLRSQKIPTKLVTGYVSPKGAYHAWNEVYLEGKGWITTGKLYFDGKNWSLMDSTFMSSGKSSKKITDYIGDGGNYTKKYEY